MSSPKYQPLVTFFRFLFCRLDNRAPVVRQPRGRTPRVYETPSKPSRQLRVVIDYFNSLRIWDLEALSRLSTPYFTQVALPASLGVPVRNKTENIEFLRSLRDSLMGAPLEILIYDISENKRKIWVHLMIKTVNVECFFLFTFGTGIDENLVTNVTQFVGNKVPSGGNANGSGGSSKPNVQSNAQPNAQPDAQPETPFQALSSSVQNCIKVMGRCYVDILLFVPRNIKYVINTASIRV